MTRASEDAAFAKAGGGTGIQGQIAPQRQIEATDGQIDALVYELYGPTEEEIRIVEGKCV